MEKDETVIDTTASKDNSNADSKNCAIESNIMESQNNVIEKSSEGTMLVMENVDKEHLIGENSSPSMLNELAEAIIADNFNALKDDKQTNNSFTDSSSKFHLVSKAYIKILYSYNMLMVASSFLILFSRCFRISKYCIFSYKKY